MPDEAVNSEPEEERLRSLYNEQIMQESMMREFGEMDFPELLYELLGKRIGPDNEGFDALAFDEWAISGAATDRQQILARFILKVWDRHAQWKCGEFDIADVALLDTPQRRTIIKWVASPFFC